MRVLRVLIALNEADGSVLECGTGATNAAHSQVIIIVLREGDTNDPDIRQFFKYPRRRVKRVQAGSQFSNVHETIQR